MFLIGQFGPGTANQVINRAANNQSYSSILSLTQSRLELICTGILVNKFVYQILYYMSTMAKRFVFQSLKQELGSGILDVPE